ncbi:hypothetical protein K504DRAFT_459655 [Pleomassaria siparia CBS 279.74]|uniref:Uncharacterized protein n=1 Tax=Pleomassaria siparia CBS 279.74 TaxID=1314801 RepID=A0A6G1K1H4_9PLEO|nr:hypothetical protein K504DRAFT_459655 [Pleomassaria siparia CBS 279.74]
MPISSSGSGSSSSEASASHFRPERTATTMKRTGRRPLSDTISLSSLHMIFFFPLSGLASDVLNSLRFLLLFLVPIRFSLPASDLVFGMLRLRPSEITLTPVDVEETRHRMARNQIAVPTARFTRVQRPRVRPNLGPRLRHGPEHSRDDAIICLGNIPILRPRHAIHDSTDDDLGHGIAGTTEHKDDISISNIPPVSLPTERALPISNDSPVEPSIVHGLQLPFRPAPARFASRENTDEDVLSSPPKQSLEYPGLGRTRTNTSEDTNEGTAQSRLPASTDGTFDAPEAPKAPGTALVAERGRVRSVRQHSSHDPSPLRETDAMSSPRQAEMEQERIAGNDTPVVPPPTMYLQGFFASPEQYTFRQYPLEPRTEPLQRSQRSGLMARTMSSNSDPPQSALGRRLDASQPSSTTEDIFWTPLSIGHTQGDISSPIYGSERHRRHSSLEERILAGSQGIADFVHDHYHGLLGRGRAARRGANSTSSGLNVNHHASSQRLSEASSNASLPYSYYELPVSRHSSSNHSQGEQLLHSQYDGAASSREDSCGAYYSIRPSHVHLRPPPTRVSSFSSPNLAVPLGQHGVSPAPSSPYSHGPKGSTRPTRQDSLTGSSAQPGASTTLISSPDFVGRGRDAASAAQRDLSSPLELLEQRASSSLLRMGGAMHTASGSSQRSSEIPSVFHYQVADFDEQQTRRRTPGSNDMRQSSGNNTRARMSTTRRRPAVTRAGHRSSENLPVGAQVNLGRIQNGLAMEGGTMRGGDLQTSPIPLRFSIPQGSSPRNLSDRPQLQPSYLRSSTIHTPRDLDRGTTLYSSNPATPFQGRRPVSRGQEYVPLRPHGGMAHEGEQQRRNPARTHAYAEPRGYHERVDPAPVPYRYPERASVGPIFSRGLMTRRPVMTHAPASRRRITPQQLNQENSGDVENELMREEMVAAGMRYAEDEQQDTMDETPPRLGRFERRALG